LIKVFNFPDDKDSLTVKTVCLEVAISMAFEALLLVGSFLGNFLSLPFVFILLRIRVRPERVESSDWSNWFGMDRRVNSS